ncbi:amidase [Streptomyces sp. NPDC098077]|uniref:amidase n=1 Tax=Streptomyces sp. NPDC098077 TaxID=3366093 RepID=UPI00382FB5EA
MGNIHDLGALEQAKAVRLREISPVQIVDHYLERIAEHNETVGAFITVTEEHARKSARSAEKAVLDGLPLGPLHGVPTAIKDLNNTNGVTTTFGSATKRHFVPDFDDHVVIALRRSGVISLGKTNVPEFGAPVYTENAIAPSARTPWDLSLSAGGSSGGAATAVASGLVPFAQGSDGGGSIRIPAGVCGVFSIKPSRGRVSNGPASNDVTGFATNGAISRTVADAAALLDAMAVPFAGELYHAPPLPDGETFEQHATRAPGRLRVGRYITPLVPGARADPVCVAAWEDLSDLLAGLGHDVVEVQRPMSEDVWGWFRTVLDVGSAGRRDIDEWDRLTPLTRWLRGRGDGISGEEFYSAMKGIRMASRRAINDSFPYDVLLSPTVGMPPQPIGWFTEGLPPESTFARMERFSCFSAIYNITGQPAVNVPLCWSREGLPIGMTLAGRPFEEATLISLAAQLEAARPWTGRVPEVWK